MAVLRFELKMKKQAVILAGGKGTRLGELTRHTPKPLLTVGEKPFIVNLVSDLGRFGFREFVILVGPYKKEFEKSLGYWLPPNVDVKLVSEPNPAGTAGALIFAAPFLAEKFLLLNGDSFFDFNYLGLMQDFGGEDVIARMALRRVRDTGRYGSVKLQGNYITDFGEKAHSGPGLINAGVYWLKRDILGKIFQEPCSMENDLLPLLVSERQVQGVPYAGNFIDIGTPEDFERSQQIFDVWLSRKAVFLDRDGVLNKDNGYVHKPEDFIWMPGAREAVRFLNDRGYLVFVVTNQSGIARGFYQVTELHTLHCWVNAKLNEVGAHIDHFYFCPHHPSAGDSLYTRVCDCRKPAPGMILKGIEEWSVNVEESFLIGDKDTDIKAAENAGVRGYVFDGKCLYSTVKNIVS